MMFKICMQARSLASRSQDLYNAEELMISGHIAAENAFFKCSKDGQDAVMLHPVNILAQFNWCSKHISRHYSFENSWTAIHWQQSRYLYEVCKNTKYPAHHMNKRRFVIQGLLCCLLHFSEWVGTQGNVFCRQECRQLQSNQTTALSQLHT